MPVLNRADTIEKAIKSVLQQNYPYLEFIILDGASTDDTPAIIKRYEASLAYWHSLPDGSPTVAVNQGIQMATGDLVVLFMADDWYEPNTFEYIAKAYLANPHADMFTCAGRIVERHPDTHHYKVKMIYDSPRRMALTCKNICFDVTSAICCRFIRRDLFKRTGLFPLYDQFGKHMFSNDKAMLIQAVLHQAQDVFVPYIGHNYLAHADSSTFGGNHKNILKLCYEHIELARTLLAGKQLSSSQRYLMHYWYNDQLTRLVLFTALDRDFRTSRHLIRHGFSQYPFFWLPAFLFTTVKIIGKRVGRKVSTVVKKKRWLQA